MRTKLVRFMAAVHLANYGVLLACSSGGGNRAGVSSFDGSVTSETSAMCPDASVFEVPNGACTVGINCVFVISTMCMPDVYAIPESSPVYICTCASGGWQCTHQPGGGLGIVLCNPGGGGFVFGDGGGG